MRHSRHTIYSLCKEFVLEKARTRFKKVSSVPASAVPSNQQRVIGSDWCARPTSWIKSENIR